MKIPYTKLTPGRYQYSYPTFADTPQYIDIHFLTPDGQQAFVSYPRHRNRKAPQLISVRWFESVTLRRLDGQVMLMTFLQTFLTNWSIDGRAMKPRTSLKLRSVSTATELLAA